MTAYYNEHDLYAAQWLRNLIAAGHIAPGVVDTRSIEDIKPYDLRGFTQCHFFAGIGVWSLALRRAGWPDDRPIWTGSCPCQPFSAAGEGNGFDDERHLWPHFLHLIAQHRPATIVGEQVSSKDADPWIDLVQADLEAMDYAVGAVAFPSASVGAPHIRDRTYWMGHTGRTGLEGQRGRLVTSSGYGATTLRPAAETSEFGGLANGHGGIGGQGSAELRRRVAGSDAQPRPGLGGNGVPGRLEHPDCSRQQSGRRNNSAMGHGVAVAAACKPSGLADAVGRINEPGSTQPNQWTVARGDGSLQAEHRPAGPTNGYWRNADWLACRDAKWRPVEPGTFPLAYGAPARVGRLRAYGNAINAEAARVFLECVIETIS